MKKIKLSFYGLYILYFLVGVFLGVYSNDLVLYWDWDPFDNSWIQFGRFMLKFGGVGIIFTITMIIIENFEVFFLNRKIKNRDIEILELKSKLYDRSVDQVQEEKQDQRVEQNPEGSIAAPGPEKN